ncbi:MAG: RNA-binding protein [Bacteroidota bacterium]|nr:RNA-binding protein [Bacteroidota bacterium]
MIKLFVAKLNPETNSEDLKRLFSPFGRVTSAKIVMDAKSGNSKNYGFVEMSHDRAALQAIDELHHSIFMDYEIIVKRSEPKGDLLQEERQTNEYLHKPRRRSD